MILCFLPVLFPMLVQSRDCKSLEDFVCNNLTKAKWISGDLQHICGMLSTASGSPSFLLLRISGCFLG